MVEKRMKKLLDAAFLHSSVCLVCACAVGGRLKDMIAKIVGNCRTGGVGCNRGIVVKCDLVTSSHIPNLTMLSDYIECCRYLFRCAKLHCYF